MWRLRLGPPRGGGGRHGASITGSGVVYFHAIALITLAALNASVNLLFLVIGLGVGMALIGMVTANTAIRKLRLTREAPDAVLAGRPFTIRYRVTNKRNRAAAFALRIRETVVYGDQRLRVEGYVETVPPGETVMLDVSMTVPQRGRLQFKSARLSTRFPFGLFERRMTVAAEHQTLVFPALFPVRQSLKGRQALLTARSLSAREQKQGNDEFYGLREYRHGDNPKRIHWRSTARTGQLLVREMADLKPQSIVVILDTYLLPGAEESLRERAISAAATVLCHALEQGYRLALIVNAANPVVIPPTSGRGLRSQLMTHLVQIEGRTPRPAARFLQGLRWRGNWRGRCLLIAPVAHESVWEAANAARPHVGSVEVITASGPEFAVWFGPEAGRNAAEAEPCEPVEVTQ